MATRKDSYTAESIATQAEKTVQMVQSVATKSSSKVDRSTLKMRTVAIRINETDYNHLNSLFTAQGTSIATAGRLGLFYLAEQIEAGILSVPNGALYRNPK